MKKTIGAIFGLSFSLAFALPMFASAATVNISVGDDFFNSKTVTINQGDTVVWTNAGAMAHTVTADNGAFNSGNLNPGQNYSQTFSGVGTIAYHCAYHGGVGGAGMAGTIVVQAAAAAVPTAISTGAPQDTSSLQGQAQLLLQQVAQLQAQLAAQQGGGTTGVNVSSTASAPAGSTGSSCPNIGRILKRASTGDDVSRLQRFLAADPSVYPEGTVSGYYGALTEKAVQRWQLKNNIISGGSPSTTGYGQVGPRTAAAIALLCSTGASSPVGGFIQVSPISGNAPLNVNVVATVNSTNSCTGAIYQLNWGDGTNPVSIPVSAGNCQPISQTYQHTYNSGGTYPITLSSGAHQTGASITVYGNSSTGGTTGGTTGTPSQGETFTASPTSGPTPLAVTFTGIVTGADQGWCSSGCSDILVLGDGSQAAVPLPTAQNGTQSYSLQHTYTNSGTYTATLYQGQAANGRPTVGSPVTITAGSGSGSTSTYNPPTVTPGVGGNPLAVQIQFELAWNQCSNYTLTWGDGSNSNPQSVACTGSSGLTTFSPSHTYAAAGNYTITLTRGTQTNTAGVNIQ